MSELTAAEVRKLFKYDPMTGVLTNRVARKNRALKGDVAGSVTEGRYRIVFVKYKQYPAHRLVWLYVYGKWPDREIDHINGIRTDNRIENLRLATRTQNSWNRGRPSNNTSGYKNVFWHSKDRKWFASVSAAGKRHHSPQFTTIEEAIAAADEMRAKLHDKFAKA